MDVPPVDYSNPFAFSDFVERPYWYYDRLRETDPVRWSAALDAWVVTSYADTLALLRDPRWSSRRVGGLLAQLSDQDRASVETLENVVSGFILLQDPPKHTRLRALASRAFSPRAVDGWRSRIQAIVDELLDAAHEMGEFDVIEQFAVPLPLMVISDLLGTRREDIPRLKKWSDDLSLFMGVASPSLELSISTQASLVEFMAYFHDIVEERRVNPTDDLISGLVHAREDGEALRDEEIFSICVQFFTAGNDTTTNMIAGGILALLQWPDEMERLRGTPSLVDGAVDEVLRYDCPVQFTIRTASADVELGGRSIRAGERALVMLGAANRDPEQFARPEVFDVTRTENRHVGFGFGAHFCLAAALARLEGTIAITSFLDRMRAPRIEETALEWRDNICFRRLRRLNVSGGIA